MNVSAPELLTQSHQLQSFDSGTESLDNWLKQKALKNQMSGASRTFVACNNKNVLGYYALASGSISLEATRGKFRRNMPNPIPVVILSRLAVDRSVQNKGLGRALFRDAAKRVIQAADTIGIRGMIVHAVSNEAKTFYEKIGLEPSPIDPMILMVTLSDLIANLNQTNH